MMGRGAKIGLLVACTLALAGCAGDRDGVPTLLNIGPSGTGPDEFVVLPTKPLEIPNNLAALPAPTPGGVNRTDPTPQNDLYIALGGGPRAGSSQAGEGALLNYAGRFGVAPGIRTDLAAADLEFRRANDGRLLERVFSVNVYFRAYEEQALDQHVELERFRRAGVPTPSAPPEASLLPQE
ncbi:MAG: DUF3035 domain-containing protein [Pseudomonadota bacterium]